MARPWAPVAPLRALPGVGSQTRSRPLQPARAEAARARHSGKPPHRWRNEMARFLPRTPAAFTEPTRTFRVALADLSGHTGPVALVLASGYSLGVPYQLEELHRRLRTASTAASR